MLDALQTLDGLDEAALLRAPEDDIARYITDWTGMFESQAEAVLRPSSTAEVSAIMRWAHEHKVPVVPMGGNTGLCGGATTSGMDKAIILSLERMKQIRHFDAAAMTMEVEAGCILEELHKQAEEADLFFPLYFGARGNCMIGGNLSTNAGGSNVLRYGNTRDLCLGLEVVLPDGRILNLLSGLRKNNTGYDLKNLFIGAEGTLGIITAASLKMVPMPKARATAFLALNSISDALAVLNRMQRATGGAVEAFELMPDILMRQYAEKLPHLKQPFENPPRFSVLMEIATPEEARAAIGSDGKSVITAELEDLLGAALEEGQIFDAVVAQNEQQRYDMWHLRESAALVMIIPQGVTLDVALPLSGIEAFLEDCVTKLEPVVPGVRLSPLSHLGDGNLHLNVLAADDEAFPDETLRAQIIHIVDDLVVAHKGSFSAEHGIGLAKKKEMSRLKDPVALAVMRAIKSVLDPHHIMNPGKVVPSA